MTQNSFTTIISASEQTCPLLPVAHTCDGWRFRSILKGNRLDLPDTPCDVYNENLSYFFYGRPGYRGHNQSLSTSINSMYLVSIILDTHTIPKPKRILPFDSGAFNNQLFADCMHPSMKLEDFELYGDILAAPKIVSCFFGTNQNYWKGKPKSEIAFKSLDFEAECYSTLIKSRSNSAYDDRKSCIEIQINQDIKFDSSNILAIVVPECFADEESVKIFIDEHNTDLLTYECYHAKPNEDARSIIDKVHDYFLGKGLL